MHKPQPLESYNNETLAILVIDDDKGDRIACQRTLKAALGNSLQFIEADNGKSGLEHIQADAPHFVMLDYSMPNYNGIEVLQCIRAKHPYLPVIMLTDNGSKAIATQSIEEGAQEYVIRSTVTPETLKRVVGTAIRHTHLQKQEHEQRISLEIFTRALVHDLKEPLRTIHSFLDQITDWRILSEESQQSFHYVRRAAIRMTALVDTVYLYIRLDAAEKIEKVTCDLSGILEEVQENLTKLIVERGATITCDALPLVHTNRVQMIQLFQNLLTNSIRHCDTPVTVHVSAEEQDDRWQLTVRDDGPGMEAEWLETIFDPFKRLSHRKEDGAGLGLGLAINRKIVGSHDGKIWCESVLGTGTSFLFTLPKAIAAAHTEKSEVPLIFSVRKPIASATQTLARILLVDDNEDDIALNRRILIEKTQIRCDVLTARDGKEAMIMLKGARQENNPIDLLLLDINMPVMSGFELLAKLHKEHILPDIMVVMCTISGYDRDKQMATEFGAAGYLTKPPEFSQLKEIIGRSERLRLYQEGNNYTLRRAA